MESAFSQKMSQMLEAVDNIRGKEKKLLFIYMTIL